MLRKLPGIISALGILAFVVLGVLTLIRPTQAQLRAVQTWFSTTGGTVNAQTLTIPNVLNYSDLVGVTITGLPGLTNTGPMTLNVNSIGTKAVLRVPSGAALGGAEVQSGVPISLLYNGTNFYIISPQITAPVGSTIEMRGSTAPTGYLVEDGSCVSQTTYAALFAYVGSTYGSCTTGLFAVPDSRGTSFMALDGQGVNGLAGRLTSASCATPNTVNGAVCGAQTQTLSSGQIPTITSNTSATTTLTGTSAGTGATTVSVIVPGSGSGIGGGGSFGLTSTAAVSVTGTASVSGTVTGLATSSNTGGQSHPILPPVVLGLRAIKY
jgi:microcystin-dependent protein